MENGADGAIFVNAEISAVSLASICTFTEELGIVALVKDDLDKTLSNQRRLKNSRDVTAVSSNRTDRRCNKKCVTNI